MKTKELFEEQNTYDNEEENKHPYDQGREDGYLEGYKDAQDNYSCKCKYGDHK